VSVYISVYLISLPSRDVIDFEFILPECLPVNLSYLIVASHVINAVHLFVYLTILNNNLYANLYLSPLSLSLYPYIPKIDAVLLIGHLASSLEF
jgi:hypothetical protein